MAKYPQQMLQLALADQQQKLDNFKPDDYVNPAQAKRAYEKDIVLLKSAIEILKTHKL